MVEPYQQQYTAQPTAPELMANELRRAIALGAFEPGDRLPTERTLAERLSISRMTVRAAMRILARDGLVITLRGRGGGTVIATRAATGTHAIAPSRSIDTFMLEIHDNLECRLAVEPLAAELAAKRAEDDERQGLLELLDERATSIRHYRMLDSRLHTAIAKAAHNDSLLPIIEGLRMEFFLWADAAWASLDWATLPPARRDFARTHQALVHAIVEGRGHAARRLMHRHIETGLTEIKTVIAPALETQHERPS